MAKTKPAAEKPAKSSKQRTYLSQADMPIYSLGTALKIPQAITDNYGNGSSKPLEVAQALEVAKGASCGNS